MSDEIEMVDMGSDPFDDVVEIEPTEEVESEDTEQKEDDGEVVESEEEGSEEEDDEEDGDSEGKEDSEEPTDDSNGEDEKPLPDFAKAIEDGSLEIDIADTKVSLKDLKNDYIGQKEISKRFTEYDIRNKQLEADKSEINEYINTFAGHLKNGDAIGAMQYFGTFAGSPPHMVKEQLIAALRPEILRRESMSPMEIQNENLNDQNEYLTQQRESENERSRYEQSQQELSSSINELRETNGISENEWQDTISYLEKTLPDEGNHSPELVRDTILYGRMYEQAESIVKASGERLEDEA